MLSFPASNSLSKTDFTRVQLQSAAGNFAFSFIRKSWEPLCSFPKTEATMQVSQKIGWRLDETLLRQQMNCIRVQYPADRTSTRHASTMKISPSTPEPRNTSAGFKQCFGSKATMQAQRKHHSLGKATMWASSTRSTLESLQYVTSISPREI